MKRRVLILAGIPLIIITMLFATEQLVMSGTYVGIAPLSWPSDARQSPQKQTGTTGPPVEADLSISKTGLPNPVTVGDPLTYTLSVTNESGPDATGVTVVDFLPVDAAYGSPVTSQGSCSRVSFIMTCNLGTLTGFSSAIITIVVTPTQATTLINTARVVGVEPDPDLNNNTAVAQTVVIEPSPSTGVYLPIIFKNYSPTAPSAILQWDDVESIRDRVRDLDGGAGLCSMFPCDFRNDGVFRLNLNIGSGLKVISNIRLISEQGVEWDTIPGNTHSVLGVYDNNISLNNPADGSVYGVIFGSSPVTMQLYASDDASYTRFRPGEYTFTVVINFDDGTSISAQTTPF